MPDSCPNAAEQLAQINCRLFRVSQIAHLAQSVPWLWHGYLARHALTLLTGQWKIGKTTLLAALLARLEAGGNLAGGQVSPGRAVVISEEGAGLWLIRAQRHGIGDAVSFCFNPFIHKPLARQWGQMLEDLVALHSRQPIDLVVLDPLAALLPGQQECSAAAMTDALRPVRGLAATGPAVLMLHHPRKGQSIGGQAARGTGALSAVVDFILEMNWAGRPTDDNRRRWLMAWSRHAETPRQVQLELSSDGRDYAVVADEPEVPVDTVGETVEVVLRSSPLLMMTEILEHWPATVKRPSQRRLTDRLREMTDAGQLERAGAGNRYEPYRYRVVEAPVDSYATATEPGSRSDG